MNTAIYFHPETCKTAIDRNKIEFIGQSLPYFDEVRHEIRKHLNYTELLLTKSSIEDYKVVHKAEYVDALIALSKGQKVEMPNLSLECTNLYYALEGHEYALGGVYSALDLMKQGALDRAYCFSLGSHHAFPDRGHGYCILNTMAAGVRYAQSIGFRNVLIIDWDFHHGDGTQAIFANDPSVYCISIHSATDLYMALVRSIEYGTTTFAKKVGHCNIPVLSKDYSEDFYFNEFKLTGNIFRSEQIHEQFNIELDNLPFSPDIIFIFDGHDGHIEDCGKNETNFEFEDFKKLTISTKEVAKKAGCPILSMPGGGYKLSITTQSAVVHVEELFRS
jgi:acetoin utilization deacetylase AcuC-like enzyme